MSARRALMLLLLATLGQQIWHVSRAVLPAQDAVDFVSVAQRIDREGGLPTLRAETMPPLFPASVCATHRALTRLGLIAANDWARAAQLAATVPLVLAVVPGYFFARRMVGSTAAVCGTLLFFSLPEVARLGADGISDGLHLFLIAWALWAVAAALGMGSEVDPAVPPMLAWWTAGSFTGLALLVRSEGVVIAAAVALLGCGALYRRILYGRGGAGEGASPSPALLAWFASGALVALLPCAAAALHPAEWYGRIRGGGAPSEDAPINAAPATLETPAMQPTFAEEEPALGRKDPTRSIRFHGLIATGREFAMETAQASAYFFLPLAIVGLYAERRQPKTWAKLFAAIVIGVHVTVTFVVAWRGGYLSSRHLLLPLLAAMPWAGLGVVLLGVRLDARLAPTARPSLRSAWALASTAAVVCFVSISQPAHTAQVAHRQAAQWLMTAQAARGAVLEQHGFTALFSGRPTYRFDASSQALGDPNLSYVLLERADLEADSPRGAKLRELLGDASRAVAQFADHRSQSERDVLVFARPAAAAPSILITAQRETSSHAR
ncbi:MAG: hypothetical protein C0483_21140 [Pirellula sp.]|nr:hypothetical protein [Pirellula sp.]